MQAFRQMQKALQIRIYSVRLEPFNQSACNTSYTSILCPTAKGLKFLMDSGVAPAVISGRSSDALKARLNDLGFTEIFLGVHNKVRVAEELLIRHGLNWNQVASMGDDWPDIPMLMKSRISFAPPNAHKEVRNLVDHITQSQAGSGAVREVCDFILKLNGQYDLLLNKFVDESK